MQVKKFLPYIFIVTVALTTSLIIFFTNNTSSIEENSKAKNNENVEINDNLSNEQKTTLDLEPENNGSNLDNTKVSASKKSFSLDLSEWNFNLPTKIEFNVMLDDNLTNNVISKSRFKGIQINNQKDNSLDIVIGAAYSASSSRYIEKTLIGENETFGSIYRITTNSKFNPFTQEELTNKLVFYSNSFLPWNPEFSEMMCTVEWGNSNECANPSIKFKNNEQSLIVFCNSSDSKTGLQNCDNIVLNISK